jgi:hypothetical protein
MMKCFQCCFNFAFNFNSRRHTTAEAKAADVAAYVAELIEGRGLHSSTSQLNLSRFWHKIHPGHPLILPDTH